MTVIDATELYTWELPKWLILCYIHFLCVLSHLGGVQLCATPWTVALQAPLSEGFSRQEHWSGLPGPPLGALPDSGFKASSPISPALASRFFTTSATWEAQIDLQA